MKKAFPYVAMIAVLIAIPSFAITRHINNIVYQGYGFSITPLDGDYDKQPISPVTFRMPTDSGFLATVDVQIIPCKEGFSAYINKKINQLNQQQVAFLKSTTYARSAELEYQTTQIFDNQKQTFHTLQKFEYNNRRLYIVTGHANEDDWFDVEDEIEDCIDSLEIFSEDNPYSDRVISYEESNATHTSGTTPTEYTVYQDTRKKKKNKDCQQRHKA